MKDSKVNPKNIRLANVPSNSRQRPLLPWKIVQFIKAQNSWLSNKERRWRH
jgi:hypothetical protein